MQVGAAQINIVIGEKADNLHKCLNFIEIGEREDIDILVFPECALTGYVFNSYDEAFQIAEPVPGKSTNVLEKACCENKITTVIGLLEKENDELYNTSVLISPEGIVGKYRKSHLLCLGVDRYVSRGEELPVFNISQGQAGMLVCYDQRFPEPARVLALKGAQMILNPTNLPEGAESYADFFNQARACENRVYIVSANRVGEERNVRFIGRSQIISCSGQILAEADATTEMLIKAEISPRQADLKHIVNIPREYELDIFGDRRPELYELIIRKRLFD